MTEDVLGLNGAYTGSTSSTSASGADLYVPDQPLWSNNGPEASAALSGLTPKIDETEPLLNIISLIVIMAGYVIVLIMNCQLEAPSHKAQICLFGVELVVQEVE